MSPVATPPPEAPSPEAVTPTADAAEVRCDHCNLPVPPGLIDSEQPVQFCCRGCASVYRMIHGCDLGQFYRLRDAVGADPTPSQPEALNEAADRYAAFDDPAFLDAHTRRLPNGARQVDLRLGNVHCAACVWLVERLPRVCPGVVEARLSLSQLTARVTWDPDQIALGDVARSLHKLGYPPHPAGERDARGARLEQERRMLVRIAVAGVCAGNAMLLAISLYLGLLDGMAAEFETFLRRISLGLAAVALGWPGSVFFRGAWASWRTRRVTLDLPIALALGVGGLAGTVNVVLGRGEIYFDSLCVLVFLLLVGRYLQVRQQRRAIDDVALMQSLAPVGCEVWRDGGWVHLSIESVRPGDRVRVPSNQRLPVDGTVEVGQSALDTSPLTGESRPQSVRPGDAVFAGSHNVGPAIELAVTAAGRSTRLSQLMEAAASDVSAKPVMVRFVDRVAGVFTVVLVSAAAVVFGAWWWAAGLEPAIHHAVALLIVACPCALGLATPMTFALATGVAARHDILVKDPAVFEKLAAVGPARSGVLALDKTGTLTLGRPEVVAWRGDPAWQPLVGAAERHSQHPVGRALAEAYDTARNADPNGLVEHARGGVSATIDGRELGIGSARWLASRGVSVDEAWCRRADDADEPAATRVWVAVDGCVMAVALLNDAVRPDTDAVVRAFAAEGVRPVILTGDNVAAAQRVAGLLGIEEQHTHAELSPEDKTRFVAETTGEGAAVVMVGDGVNDAAALARADVGLAVRGGAEAALAVADAYTHRPGLRPLVELRGLGRLTVRIVRQNLAVSLGYNTVAVGLAAAGLLTPWIAAILMPVSSLTVLGLAASRLSRWKSGR